MANFGQKPWVNPFGKISIFSTFWTCCFYSLETRFFVLEYRKTHFPGLYCLKTKDGKMANFKQKPWVNPFGKIAIFSTFWTCCFCSLEKRFIVLEYRKTHFPALYCLKTKDGKMANFGSKPWVNPFAKIAIFFAFWTCCCYSLERRFFVLEYRKTHFPAL